ncbi:phosphatase PAP2 family protein [Vibrio owensii]|uniref:phosphatase PAP2 family protein n=1 Tax=Vibrio owensii TaxID=696485 RepID=UPI00390A79E3
MAQDNNYELPLNWQQKVSLWFGELKVHLLKDKVLYLYCAVTTVVIYSFSLYFQSPIRYSLTTYLETIGTACYITFLMWCSYYYFYLIVQKEKSPTKQFLRKLAQIFFPLNRTIAVATLVLMLTLVFSNHTFLKSLIPVLHPFSLDEAFINIDRVLHFGVDPWVITHSLFPGAWSSFVLNMAYNAWFFLMWGMLIFFLIYKKRPQLRQQFLLSFVLSWMVIGFFFATLLSSVGPCYVEPLSENNYFSPLMETLRAQSQYLLDIEIGQLWALATQEHLWHDYIEQANSIGSGISAMPSMHVSIAVLIALSIYRLNKIAGYVAYFFALIIQIGSVHLAWHYAIDGYFATVLTILIWKGVGYLIHRYPSAFPCEITK